MGCGKGLAPPPTIVRPKMPPFSAYADTRVADAFVR